MDEKFNAILSIVLIPQVIDLIARKQGWPEESALSAIYCSKTYELLSDEATKLWHFSPLMLYSIWEHEHHTNTIVLPEE